MATTAASQSQNYMINIETVAGTPQLSSQIEGFETFGPLYNSTYFFEKKVAPDAGADLFSSSMISASPVLVTIQNGIFIQDLTTSFLKGVPIQKITFLTLANVNGTNKKNDQVVFENNYILSLKAGALPDSTVVAYLSFRYTKYTHTVFQYDQSGTPPGQNESTFDLTKGTTGG